MPDAYLVEIHRFLHGKKEAAERGLKGAITEADQAFFKGALAEVARMEAFVSRRYDMAFRDYGKAV